MTTVFAQRMDNEIKYFFDDAVTRMNGKYARTFDCKPFVQFNGTPKQWREQRVLRSSGKLSLTA